MPETTEPAKENIFSSLVSFTKQLFTRLYPFTISGIQSPRYEEIEENNPLKRTQDYIKNDKKAGLQEINAYLKLNYPADKPVTIEELDSALKHYVAEKEIKEGDVIKVKDGQVSYADLKRAAQDVENVSDKDAAFSKMPRIFLIAKRPENQRESMIISALGANNFSYVLRTDSILINQTFPPHLDAETFKSVFAHEYGHRVDKATRGWPSFEYDLQEHVKTIFLGDDKFHETCVKPMLAGIAPDTAECKQAKEIIDKHKAFSVDPEIDRLNQYFNHDREKRADLYATLAGYGKALANILFKADETASAGHPSTIERVDEIKQVMFNPSHYKQELETNIAYYGILFPRIRNSNHELKPAPQTPAIEAGSNVIRNKN